MSRLRAEIHPLLTEEVVAVLNNKLIFTVLDFLKADTQQIVKNARLNFREVLAIKNFLLKKFGAAPISGFDHLKLTLKNAAIVPTGIKGVDHLLDGGFFTGNIYEICGLAGAGKTQFVLSLMKYVIRDMQHQQVYIFDTKNDFSAAKIKSMMNGCDEEQMEKSLNRIIVSRTCNKYELINGLYEVKNRLEHNLKLRVIIIDSLPCVLFDDNDHSANNSYINHLENIMRYIASEHHVFFLVTNLITTWIDSDFKTVQNSVETVSCGKYWSSVPNTRLKIEKTENSKVCKISILNSDTLGQKINSSVEIQLTDEGFL